MVEECSVDGCAAAVFVVARGLCRLHYDRWWRFGDVNAKLTRHPQGTPVSVRLWSFVDSGAGGDDCWIYTGSINPQWGYGRIKIDGRQVPAHRVAYELAVGPIPAGMDLDHLCHTRDLSCPGGPDCPHRKCVNPSHLEPTTGRENRLRGRSIMAVNAAKTHCKRGHPFDEANTYYSKRGRICRACQNASQRAYQQRKRSAE